MVNATHPSCGIVDWPKDGFYDEEQMEWFHGMDALTTGSGEVSILLISLKTYKLVDQLVMTI